MNHEILLTKMEAYGFHWYVNDFIESYLTNRQQFTVINGRYSSLQRIDTCVPQGSVLGPLFFLLYINDIPKCVNGVDISLFAYETSVLLGDGSLEKRKGKAKKCLKYLDEWFKSNKLTLSTEKTYFSIYHTKRKQIHPQYDNLRLNSSVIKRVAHVKYLGVYLDEHLSWDTQKIDLCNNLAKYLSVFYNVRMMVTETLKK